MASLYTLQRPIMCFAVMSIRHPNPNRCFDLLLTSKRYHCQHKVPCRGATLIDILAANIPQETTGPFLIRWNFRRWVMNPSQPGFGVTVSLHYTVLGLH